MPAYGVPEIHDLFSHDPGLHAAWAAQPVLRGKCRLRNHPWLASEGKIRPPPNWSTPDQHPEVCSRACPQDHHLRALKIFTRRLLARCTIGPVEKTSIYAIAEVRTSSKVKLTRAGA